MRGKAYDKVGPFSRLGSEFNYGRQFQQQYNVAILLGEERLKHLGEQRAKGLWYE